LIGVIDMVALTAVTRSGAVGLIFNPSADDIDEMSRLAAIVP
jgi:hypothetical protein